MNPGDVLLKLAFVGALLSAALFVPALRGRRSQAAGWVFTGHALLLTVSLVVLWGLFLGRRFDYEYVAQYSSRALSPALSIAASWAGQEGSILLWVTMGALLGLALLRQPGGLTRPAMFFLSLVQSALMVLLMVRSPFRLSPVVPADGQGLNPLLEDPWMVVHPPVLFLGYAALAVPFALGLAVLIRQDYREWNRMVWPWALFGVVTLGAGIVLGGVWAYKVLGWGGYWGWDPVENASLIPWLVTVALLHGLLIQRTTGSLVRTNLVLASLAWVTVLGGTYMTRSGVLQDFSVHSFTDLGLNGPLMTFLLLSLLAPAVLLGLRWGAIGSGARWPSLSRESALWLGLVTVLVLAALVAIGTTAPVYTTLAGQPANVQPGFYHAVSLPLGIALVLLMGLAPALRWSRQQGRSWLKALMPGLVLGAVALAVGAIAGVRQPAPLALLGTTAIALGVNALWMVRLFRRGWVYGAGYLGHVGVAVMVLGMVASGTLGKSQRVRLVEGVPGQALGYEMTYRGETIDERGEHVLMVELRSGDRALEMRPRIAHMPRGDGVMRKPALGRNGELYLAALETQEGSGGHHGEPVWLEKGVESVLAGVGYTFAGFRMESHEAMQVFADIQVRREGATTLASPGLRAAPEGTQAVNAKVPGLGELHVARIDADRGRVAVVLPAADRPPAAALVELSTHPHVNLVWIGALLALLGSALAGLRRAGERLPSRVPRQGSSAYTARA